MTAVETPLIEFLRARIAEDEHLAELASNDQHRDGVYVGRAEQLASTKLMRHYSPERVLAECDAKRRIVESAHNYRPELEHGDNGEWAFGLALRELALPYGDHPDYRDEWRPDDVMPRGQYGPTADHGEG